MSGHRRGFTLIEMMVAIAIIGLMLGLSLGAGKALLPQERLKSSANDLAGTLLQMRTDAISRRMEIIFTYDLTENRYKAHLPYELDDEGHILGPGESPVRDWRELEEGMAFGSIYFADGSAREDGLVALRITPLGRIPPHDVVVYNPDYPETELFTIRVSGLSLASEIVDGFVQPEIIEDAHFR